jgi:hypothetical protein
MAVIHALTPDQFQMFLATLENTRIEYTTLRDKKIYWDERDRLQERLDTPGGNQQSAGPSCENPRTKDWREDCRTPKENG